MSGAPLVVGRDAPFPWFGGKRRVADIVWRALGDCPGYVEPFAGSLAVLLRRPSEPGTETVCDADAYVSNFWRAVQRAPEEVAHHADNPVNETDLFARHLWLVNTGRERIASLESDPEHYDAKVAGWWAWGVCCWIGSGWCSGDGPWKAGGKGGGVNRGGAKLPHLGDPGRGVNRQLPHLGDPGQGVNRQLPHLGDPGRGVNRQLPHLGNPGRGVNRQLPHLGNPGQGVNRQLPHLGNPGQGYVRTDALYEWMQALSARLRRVRIASGDWSRIITPSVLRAGGWPCGVFLDPPYETGAENYSRPSAGVAAAAREWAIANGENLNLRIVLCGYEGEGEMPPEWYCHAYSGTGAYIGRSDSAAGEGRHRERLWFSPACLPVDLHHAAHGGANPQGTIFGTATEYRRGYDHRAGGWTLEVHPEGESPAGGEE